MRIAKYFVVGGISALSDLVVFSIGVYLLHWPYLLCGLIILALVGRRPMAEVKLSGEAGV